MGLISAPKPAGLLRPWKKWDVVVAGDLFIDLVFAGFPWWPRPGEESFARSYVREIGGGTAITSCGLAKLGLTSAVSGVVGAEDGTFVVQRLRECGVDVSNVHLHNWAPTGITVSISNSDDRAMYTYYGANNQLQELLADEQFCIQMARAKHVHLAYPPEPDSADSLFSMLHETGCSVSLDSGWHEGWLSDPDILRLLRHVDLLFPNEREARLMTGKTRPEDVVEAFAEAGLPTVALKLGAKGAALLWHGKVYFSPPFRVEPIDTTGAGDCFDAGFIAAWLRGESPEQCLRIACVCGALSTRSLGGIDGFPSRDELDEALLS